MIEITRILSLAEDKYPKPSEELMRRIRRQACAIIEGRDFKCAGIKYHGDLFPLHGSPDDDVSYPANDHSATKKRGRELSEAECRDILQLDRKLIIRPKDFYDAWGLL